VIYLPFHLKPYFAPFLQRYVVFNSSTIKYMHLFSSILLKERVQVV